MESMQPSGNEGKNDCVLRPVVCLMGSSSSNTNHTKEEIIHLLYSDDGQILYLMTLGGTLRAWSILGNDWLFFCNSLNSVSHLSKLYSINNFLLLDTLCDRNTLNIYDNKNGDLIKTIPPFTNQLLHEIVFSSNYCVFNCIIIDMKTADVVKTVNDLSKLDVKAAISITENDLLLIGGSKHLLIIDLINDTSIVSINHDTSPSQIVVSKFSFKAIVLYDLGNELIIYDVNQKSSTFGCNLGKFAYTANIGIPYRQHADRFHLSRKGDKLIVNIKQSRLFNLNVDTLRANELTIHSSERYIRHETYLKDEKQIMALVNDYLCIWEANDGELRNRFYFSDSIYNSILFAYDGGNTIASMNKSMPSVIIFKLDGSRDSIRKKYHPHLDVMIPLKNNNLAFLQTINRNRKKKIFKNNDLYFGIDIWNLSTDNVVPYLTYAKYGKLIHLYVTHNEKLFVMVTYYLHAYHIFFIDRQTIAVKAYMMSSSFCNLLMSPNDNYVLLLKKHAGQLWDPYTPMCMIEYKDCVSCTFTNESKFALFLLKENILIVYLLDKMRVFKNIDLKKPKTQNIETVPNEYGCVLVSRVGRTTSTKRYAQVELWDFIEGICLWKIDKFNIHINFIKSKQVCISKNGKYLVDSNLQVYNLKSGTFSFSLSEDKFIEQVDITNDGNYIVWADSEPTDCIKIVCTITKTEVARVCTHSPVKSIELLEYGYLVVVGCNNGNLLSFRIVNTKLGDGVKTNPPNSKDLKYLESSWKLSIIDTLIYKFKVKLLSKEESLSSTSLSGETSPSGNHTNLKREISRSLPDISRMENIIKQSHGNEYKIDRIYDKEIQKYHDKDILPAFNVTKFIITRLQNFSETGNKEFSSNYYLLPFSKK